MSVADLEVDVCCEVPIPLQGRLVCNAGEMVALVGPSGAGKTTLLRAIAGLFPLEQGRVRVGSEIWFDSEKGIAVPTRARHVGLVFQSYALMPHLDALHNVALSLLHLPRAQRLAQASEWLGKVRLTDEQQHRKPSQLSGGQQQRVALARALAREPDVLLLDEPFSAVDQLSRQGLYELLAELKQELLIPIVLVTHDLQEARLLADQIAVMDGGKILQQADPMQVYRAPVSARVADLVGIRNRFHGRWLGPVEGPTLNPKATPATGAPTAPMGLLQWLPDDDIDGDTNPENSSEHDPGNSDASGMTSAAGSASAMMTVPLAPSLHPGQLVSWVIQTDGLTLREVRGQVPDCGTTESESTARTGDTSRTDHTSRTSRTGRLEWVVPVSVSEIRHLGDTSLVTLIVQAPQNTRIRMMLSGSQRIGLEQGKTMELLIDTRWVHVMALETASKA